MTYKKRYNVTGKIFYKEDLIRLFENILDTLSEEMKDKGGTHNIIIEFKDGTILTDNNISIFDHIYIEKKEIHSVEMNIGVTYSHEYVSIDLGVLSKVYIVSQNKKTFDSLQHCIDENIRLVKNQYFFYKIPENAGLVLLLFIILATIEIIMLVCLKTMQNIVFSSSINILIGTIIPALIVVFLCNYIESHYPSVEFNFGKDSINKPKEPHKVWIAIIGFIMVNIVIPYLLSKFLN